MIANPIVHRLFGTLGDGAYLVQSPFVDHFALFVLKFKLKRNCCVVDSQEQFPLKYHRRVLHINTQMNSDYSLCV